MLIGLQGTGSDIELEFVKETTKAYQVCDLTHGEMWFPKMAFDESGVLNDYGMKLYKEKCNEVQSIPAIKSENNDIINKSDHFTKELQYIKSDTIREWTAKAIESLPNYIFEVPASSTGKYHPNYALGKGGLLRHIKAAVGIAYGVFDNQTICKIFNLNTDEEKDISIAALILHDGNKSGVTNSGYSTHEHPLTICEYLKQQPFFNDIPQAELICTGISSHMGQWSTSKKSKIVLPLPETGLQSFIHMCDYLASRKFLEFKFEV